MSVDTWLRSQPDRCSECGHHPPTQGHGEACAPTGPADHWTTFVAAIRAATRPDGTVRQNDIRPLIRGRIPSKKIASFYRRAYADRLLVFIDKEPSSDTAGRNTHHDAGVYRVAA